MEGDPCGTYADVEEAPVATVKEVERLENGVMRFRAVVDHTGEIISRDTANLDPQAAWEINPKDMDLFRASIERDSKSVASGSSGLINADGAEAFRGIQMDVERLQGEVQALRNENAEFRNTMTSTVRMIAGDVLRAYRGQPAEFASRFVDRYDEAYASSRDQGRGMDVPETMHQTEKWDFQGASEEPEAVRYTGGGHLRESPVLTDDENDGLH